MTMFSRIKSIAVETKKGFQNVAGAVAGIGVAVLVAGFVLLIIEKIAATMTIGNASYTAMNTTSVNIVNGMLGLIQPLGIVVIAAVIIAYLMGAFGGKK